jgi:hypothetical protein
VETDDAKDPEMPLINLGSILNQIAVPGDADLRILNDPILGLKVHEKIGEQLDYAARSNEQLTLRIPADVIGITPSFLDKVFGDTLNQISSSEEFRKIYHIDASIVVSVQIVRAIEALLLERQKAL